MISVSKLSFAFEPKLVLNDITFTVGEGEIVSFLGRSGSGKTTLLKCIAGLLQPKSGTIEISHLTPLAASAAQKIGYMFQEDTLLEWRSVGENVALPFEIARQKRNADEIQKAVDAALDIVGLRDEANRFPFELSGGMRQRVALARSLATSPSVVVLDEPFAALDLLTREEIMIEMHGILKKAKTPAIIVTHHIEEAVFLSDRVFLLGGSPATIVHTDALEFPRRRNQELLATPPFISRVAEIKVAVRTLGAEKP